MVGSLGCWDGGALRNSGHATSPLLGGSHFGSGELAPLGRSGSGATERFALSNQAEAAQQQQGRSDSNKQAAGYALQVLTELETHMGCKCTRGAPPQWG